MRAVVLAGGAVIRADHLSLSSPRAARPAAVASLEHVERQQVQHALDVSGGNKLQAAELLGITRPRLRRLIAKYGLAAADE